jgi:RNA-binding protein 5/10
LNKPQLIENILFSHRIIFKIVVISYCVDSENRSIDKKAVAEQQAAMAMAGPVKPSMQKEMSNVHTAAFNSYQYTMADVPRLAEYSASMYASNPMEHDHYVQFYSNYYTTQISKVSFAVVILYFC